MYHIKSLIIIYLKLAQVKYRIKDVDLFLSTSNSPASISSISQTLSYFGINNNVFRSDFESLKEYGKITIAHLNIKQGRFVIIYRIDDENIYYFDTYSNKNYVLTKDEFLAIWSGVVLIATNGVDYFSKNRIVKPSCNTPVIYVFCTLIAFTIIAIFTVFLNHSESYYLTFLFMTFKSIGLVLSVLLLFHDFNLAQNTLTTICNAHKSFNCNAVLKSKYSKLFSILSFTNAGFIYFLSGIIYMIIDLIYGNFTPKDVEYLAWLSYSCIPFICFSIIYQRFFIKKWCPLCLAAIYIIMLECLVSISFFHQLVIFEYLQVSLLLYYLFALFVSVIILILTRKFIKLYHEKKESLTALLEFKRNPLSYRSHFYVKHRDYIPNITNITLGVDSAPIVITTIINPYCAPCKKVASEILDLLRRFPMKIRWVIIIEGTEYVNLNKISLLMVLLLKHQKDNHYLVSIIDDWIKSSSDKKFVIKHNLETKNYGSYKDVFYKQLDEISKRLINRTPYINLNGIEYPQCYNIGDLGYLIQDEDFIKIINDPDLK